MVFCACCTLCGLLSAYLSASHLSRPRQCSLPYHVPHCLSSPTLLEILGIEFALLLPPSASDRLAWRLAQSRCQQMFVGGTNGCVHSHLAPGLAGLRCENPVFPRQPLPLPQASAYPHTHFWVSRVLSEFPNPQDRRPPLTRRLLRPPQIRPLHLSQQSHILL